MTRGRRNSQLLSIQLRSFRHPSLRALPLLLPTSIRKHPPRCPPRCPRHSGFMPIFSVRPVSTRSNYPTSRQNCIAPTGKDSAILSKVSTSSHPSSSSASRNRPSRQSRSRTRVSRSILRRILRASEFAEETWSSLFPHCHRLSYRLSPSLPTSRTPSFRGPLVSTRWARKEHPRRPCIRRRFRFD